MFTPAEREAIARRAQLEEAIRMQDDPNVQEGLESLQLLADSRYPPELIDSQGHQAIQASLDQAGIEDPQIRQGYIDSIKMGWRVKNLLDNDKLSTTEQQSVAETRLRLQTALDRTVDLMQSGGCLAGEDFYALLGVPPKVELGDDQCTVYFQTAQNLQESLLALTSYDRQPPVGLPGEPLPFGSRPATQDGRPPGGAAAPAGSTGSPAAGAQGSTTGGNMPAPAVLQRQFLVWRNQQQGTQPVQAAKDRFMLDRYHAMVNEGVDPQAARATLIGAFGMPFNPQVRAEMGVQQSQQNQGPSEPSRNSLARPIGQ